MIEENISLDKLIKEYEKRIKLGGDDPSQEDMQYRPGRLYSSMRAKKVKNKHVLQRATVNQLYLLQTMLGRIQYMREHGIIKHRHDIQILDFIEKGIETV